MITSYQTAALFQEQQQQFAGMQSYSQQISQQMPGAYPGFNYGAPGMANSYNFGNNMGRAGIGAMSGIAQTAISSAAIPLASAGWRAGAGMSLMGRAGMAAGGFALPMLGAAAVGWAGNQMVAGAQEQTQIQNVLGNFQFPNMNARGGRGFTRQDSMQIGNMVRELAHIPEMLTSVGELTKIMERISNTGLMNGVRDAHQFQTKFKETLSTIKDVARIMGTTLDDAASAFGEARRSGFYSQRDIIQNAVNRQVGASLTGMNQQQMGALQNAGANMGFGAGGSRAGGAGLVTRTASQLGLMQQLGMLSDDKITELTGETDRGKGIQALAAQMAQFGYQMGGSPMGQALAQALGEQKDGKYTGAMDKDLAARFRRGEIGQKELLDLARKKGTTQLGRASFTAHKDYLTSEMVSSLGSEGIAAELRNILGEKGFNNPDAVNIVMQQMGVSDKGAQLMLEMGKVSSTGQLEAFGNQEKRRSARNSYMNENFSADALKKKIMTSIEAATTGPLKQAGAEIQNGLAGWLEDMIDSATGKYVAEMRSGVSQAANDLKGGGRENLKRLIAGSAPASPKFGGAGPSGLLSGFMGNSGPRSLIQGLGLGGMLGKADPEAGMAALAARFKGMNTGNEALYQNGAMYDSAKKEIAKAILEANDKGLTSDSDKLDYIVNSLTPQVTATEAGASMDPDTATSALAGSVKKGMHETVMRMIVSDPRLKGMKGAPSSANLMAEAGGMSNSIPDLGKKTGDIAKSFGTDAGFAAVKGAMNTSLLGSGALSAALTLPQSELDDLLLDVGQENPDEATMKKLARYGITKENRVEAMRLLQQTSKMTAASRTEAYKYASMTAHMNELQIRENLKGKAKDIAALVGVTNRGVAGASKSLAEKMKAGSYETIEGDIHTIMTSLAGASDDERRKILGQMAGGEGSSVLAGSFSEYSDLMNGKDKDRAIDAATSSAARKLINADSEVGSTMASEHSIKAYFDGLNANIQKSTEVLKAVQEKMAH